MFHRVLRPGLLAGMLLCGLIAPSNGLAASRVRAACADDAHVLYAGGGWAGGRYRYFVNPSGSPVGRRAVRAIIRGHQTWDRARTTCGARARAALAGVVHSSFGGLTSAHFSRQPDGVSVVDFGSMPAVGLPAIALAWTQIWMDAAGHIVETDMRLNSALRWSTSGARNAYDVWDVVAHETGHSLGLDGDQLDASHGALTMYGHVAQGETRKRTLGLGDLVALRAKYG